MSTNRLVCAACVLLIGVAAHAEQKPLWEAGLGAGALGFPDYRGSDETQVYPVPVPYFVYRGKFFKADRDGVRGELFSREHAEISISLNGTIPVQSDDSDARSGMPDLEPTIEIGPALNLHLWKSRDGRYELDFIAPLRASFTIEASPQMVGWSFSPRLNLDVKRIGGPEGWVFGVGAGPLYADRRLHGYFYDVAPRYATAERPAYEARGGYSGFHVLSAVSRRFRKYWFGAYVRYDALGGAEFADSPLVANKRYFAGGFGVARMLGESKRLVEAED